MKSLKHYQQNVKFDDELIDFSNPGIKLYNSVEKYPIGKIALLSYFIAFFIVFMFITAVVLAIVLYAKK